MPASERTGIAFVCVQNAGRSQMAFAFAARERARRGLAAEIEILTGGTQPADSVHPGVVDAMAEVGIDIADRTPRAVGVDALQQTDYVITMGCSAREVCPAGWGGESRDWALDDPDGEPPATVARIRDEVERRVGELFDELERR